MKLIKTIQTGALFIALLISLSAFAESTDKNDEVVGVQSILFLTVS